MKRLELTIASLALLPLLAGCTAASPSTKSAPSPAGPTLESSASLAPAAPTRTILVPHVKGKTATGAKWRLETAGFKVKVTWVRDSRTRGRVISQKPSGGKAQPGSTIRLTVSTGSGPTPAPEPDTVAPSASSASDKAAARAFQNHTSGVRLTGAGVVSKVLSDDNDGSRHQRFILRLASGQTLLVAHNIDIAPRLPSLQSGDSVEFNGIYEWSSQGGTIHWTHHDPSGQHPTGWLKYNGSTYK